MAPRAVFHKVGHLAAAMVAFGFVIRLSAVGLLRDKAGAVAPRAIVPLRGDAAVAMVADMRQLRAVIEAVALAAAPGATLHGFGNGLAAIDTGKQCAQHLLVPLGKTGPAKLPPIKGFFLCDSGLFVVQGLGQGLLHRRQHLFGVGKASFRVRVQRLFHKPHKPRRGPIPQFLQPPRRPVERPSRQRTGNELVQDQCHGKAVAAIRRPAECLFRGDVAGGAVVVDGFHPAGELDADTEIAQRRPAIAKQEDIVRRDVAVDQPLGMSIGQTIQNLTNNADNAANAHRPRAISQRSGGQFGSHDGVTVDDVDVLNRHQVRVAQLRQQPNFTEDGFVVTLARPVGQGDFQGDPDALQRVPGLPDLAVAAFAQPLLEPVFANALFGVQSSFFIPGCL